jgi:hypothetical protein
MMMVFVYRSGKVEQAITEARAQARGMLKIAMPVVAGDWEDAVAASKPSIRPSGSLGQRTRMGNCSPGKIPDKKRSRPGCWPQKPILRANGC